MSKFTTLSQLKTSLQSTKSYIDARDAELSSQIAEIISDIEGIVATGGEANILEGVKVNGNALTITDKMVDLLIASGSENGTISVNGAAVAITGLASLAYKSEISEAELSSALKASIAAKATQADLTALGVRVTTAEGKIQTLENAGFQTADDVSAAIQAAISSSGHAHFEAVDAVPTAENAQENVLYLVMNNTTGHYDIYALVGGSVVLIDDTTVDLSNYYTKSAADAAIAAAIAALNIDQYATDAELAAAVGRITTLEAKFANYYTKDEVDAKLSGKMNVADMGAYATDEEAAAAAATAVSAATASDAEVNAMLNDVFGE